MGKLSGSALGRLIPHKRNTQFFDDTIEPISGKNADGEYYEFPQADKNPEKRQEIGYADIPGISGFNCGNCGWYLLGNCAKYHIGVSKTACCSKGWKP